MAEEGHPCRVSSTGNPCDSLIEQLRNAIACCLSICTSLCQPREREPYQQQGPHDGTDLSTHQPPTEDDPAITTRAAVRRRQRQVPPPPSEGRGGQIN